MVKETQGFASRFHDPQGLVAQYGAMASDYGTAHFQADPLADDLVAYFAEHPELPKHALLQRALTGGIDRLKAPPPPLRAFFEHAETVPDWVDPAKCNLGARTYQRLGGFALMILSAWALINGYHSSAAVKPLAFTGQLTDKAPRRLAETGRFVTETVQLDGLRRGNPGFTIALRVRWMHAAVRRMILANPDWRSEDWGVPINQGDMLATLFEFSLLVIEGARALGFSISEQESEAILHLWRYSGYLMGIDGRWLAELASEHRAFRCAEMIHLCQPGPDEDSLALAAALRRVAVDMAKTDKEREQAKFVVAYHDAMTWFLNAPHIPEELAIPNRHYRYAIHGLRLGLIKPTEWLRQRLPGADGLLAKLGNGLVRQNVVLSLEGKEPSFRAEQPLVTPPSLRALRQALSKGPFRASPAAA